MRDHPGRGGLGGGAVSGKAAGRDAGYTALSQHDATRGVCVGWAVQDSCFDCHTGVPPTPVCGASRCGCHGLGGCSPVSLGEQAGWALHGQTSLDGGVDVPERLGGVTDGRVDRLDPSVHAIVGHAVDALGTSTHPSTQPLTRVRPAWGDSPGRPTQSPDKGLLCFQGGLGSWRLAPSGHSGSQVLARFSGRSC